MRSSMPKITLTERDYFSLKYFIERLPMEAQAGVMSLDQELDRADVLKMEEFPGNVVAMNSIVQYEDVLTGRLSTIQISFPDKANIEEGRVSVLAPIGAALIGLKVGDLIKWTFPNGSEKQLRVRSVLSDEEKKAC